MKTDIVIAGTGVAGLYCALNLPRDKKIIMVTKSDADDSDSFLAQGGICVLKDESDYDSYFEDTMRAGHYENNRESVEIMIRSSQDVIKDLISYGVEFEKNADGSFDYTKEGAHSTERILYHEDITGKEITRHLLSHVRKLENVTIIEHFTMVDIIAKDNRCYGIIGRNEDGEYTAIEADNTVFATGGIGGLYKHSTNYRHLTGDALAISLKHGIKVENLDYIQIHPTTLYSTKRGRRFLISESVRGEGAQLFNKDHQRHSFQRDIQANGKGRHAIRVALNEADTARNDKKSFSQHLQTVPERGLRRDEGLHPRSPRAALFHGRNMGRQRQQNVDGQPLRRGRNELQRRSRTQPLSEQLASRKLSFRKTRRRSHWGH